MLTPERQKVLNLISLNEKNGNFNVDVEDDRDKKKLKPNQVDYINKKLISRIKNRIANKLAINFYEKKIKNGDFRIVKVNGIENYKKIKNVGAIITCNHFSPNDNYVVYKTIKDELFTGQNLYKVIKEGNYTSRKGLLGFFFKNCNTLPLSSNVETMKKFLNSIKILLNRGEKVLIYPEQSMWWNYKKPRPFKLGAFNIAVKNNVPVLPVFITMVDGDKILEDGSLSQEYTVNIGEPIFIDEKLSEKENVRGILEKNFSYCKQVYQDFYKKELSYEV